MNFIITLLTILEVIVCLLLSLLVLMQRPRQEGLGAAFGSGVTDQMFGAQTTNVLQKATVYLGIALFGLTFLLAIFVSRQDDHSTGKATFVEPSDKVAAPPAPAPASTTVTPTVVTPTPANPADSAPADKAAPAAPATDKPATPAPNPPQTTSTPAPAPAPVATEPAPVVPTPAK